MPRHEFGGQAPQLSVLGDATLGGALKVAPGAAFTFYIAKNGAVESDFRLQDGTGAYTVTATQINADANGYPPFFQARNDLEVLWLRLVAGDGSVSWLQFGANDLLAALTTRVAALEAGGGGGGTADWNTLTNKPAVIAAGATAAAARTVIQLDQVNNTDDLDKPISTATQTALNAKANTASPTFTGTVTVPTPTAGGAATTKNYVDSAISGVSGGGGIQDGRASVITYGATGNGTTNDQPAIQTAIDAGVPLYFPAGTYRCTALLNVDSNTDIYLAPGAILSKDFANNGGTSGGFIRNRNMGTKVNDVKIHGPGTIRAATNLQTGNMFSLYGDRIMLRDFTVNQWAGGRCMVLAGDYVRVVNVKLYGSASAVNNGGIRFVGGRQFVAYGCHVESGDDSLQFVPIPVAGGDPFGGFSIHDSKYVACTGRSTDAKFMVCGLQETGIPDGTQSTGWTAGIYNSGFIGCHGFGGATAAQFQNVSSAGPIRDCYITDCGVDMIDGLTGYAGVLINGYPNLGAIERLKITRLVVRNARQQVVSMARNSIDVHFDGCTFVRGAVAHTNGVVRLGGTGTKFTNNYVDSGGDANPAIQVQGPSTGGTGVPNRMLIWRNRIVGIATGAGNCGVDVLAGDRIKIDDNRFEQIAGAADARAFRFQAGVTNSRAVDNELDQLTSTTKFTNSAGTGAFVGNTQVA